MNQFNFDVIFDQYKNRNSSTCSSKRELEQLDQLH